MGLCRRRQARHAAAATIIRGKGRRSLADCKALVVTNSPGDKLSKAARREVAQRRVPRHDRIHERVNEGKCLSRCGLPREEDDKLGDQWRKKLHRDDLSVHC